MATSVIDTVAKFFYFCTLDERVTFAASFRVLGELKNGGWIDGGHRSRWVAQLSKWRQKLGSVAPRDWAHTPGDAGFQVPPQFNPTAWSNFLTYGDPLEIEAVLLSRILNFTDDEIASGLGVTRGTVRYRVGRGLRRLGGFLES